MEIKLLHTSDWHLGKKLYKKDRDKEFTHFLNWTVKECKSRKIDILIIAGDIFDTFNPAHKALTLYYDFLNHITKENPELKVFIISGNHDAENLLNSSKEILNRHNIHIFTNENQWRPFKTKIKNKHVSITPVPFFRLFDLEKISNKSMLETKDIIPIIRDLIEKAYDKEADYNIIIAHHSFGDFLKNSTGSEHLVSISGINDLPIDIFKRYDYVALGHIHQKIKFQDNIYYSGSPLQMRFSEPKKKYVIEYNLTLKKNIEIEIPLHTKLETYKINEDSSLETLTDTIKDRGLNQYAEIKLKLEKPNKAFTDLIIGTFKKQNVEVLNIQTEFNQKEIKKINNIATKSIEELFLDYYKGISSHIDDETINLFNKLLIEVRDENQ